MTRDDQETVTLNDPTAWQETAMPATASVDPDPRVRVSQDDLMAAVHGGVITGVQAKALWLRWSDPGQAAAQANSPGPRALPEPAAVAPAAAGSGRGTLVTAVLVVLAAAAGWALRGLMR
jgi:hypothetical protein